MHSPWLIDRLYVSSKDLSCSCQGWCGNWHAKSTKHSLPFFGSREPAADFDIIMRKEW
jgi:hypothetical protein